MTARTSRESAQLRERAIALRRAGKSVRQIKQLLGPVGNRKLHDALRGEPPPEWTRRPNAKDDLRAEARELRRQGLDYAEIVRRLGVSKSSVSLWVRDLPRPPRIPLDECAKRTSEGIRRYGSAERPVRAAQRTAAIAAAAQSIGDLTGREILIAGAVAYREQRSGAHFILPALPGHRRDPALRSGFPAADPRDCRRSRGDTVLAHRDRGAPRPVPESFPETGQSPDYAEEHGRRLLRMPAGGRQAQLRALPED